MLYKIKLFIIISVLLCFVGYTFYNQIVISKLKSEIIELKESNKHYAIANVNLNGNILTLEHSIEEQNKQIEDLELALKEAQDSFEQWKSLPESIRYKSLEEILNVNGKTTCQVVLRKLYKISNLKYKDL